MPCTFAAGTDGQCRAPSTCPDDRNLQAQAGAFAYELLNLRSSRRLAGSLSLLLFVHGLEIDF